MPARTSIDSRLLGVLTLAFGLLCALAVPLECLQAPATSVAVAED